MVRRSSQGHARGRAWAHAAERPASPLLYDPRDERAACGVGFVADLRAPASHRMLETALGVLRRLEHRGAQGSDPETGDGAGLMTQIPHEYLERVLAREGKELPPAGDYGLAQVFLSRDPTRAHLQMKALVDIVRHHNQKVIGWRDVPVDPRAVGPVGRASLPVMRQLFIARMCDRAAFERTLFLVRKRAGKIAITKGYGDDLYVASLSSRTVVYKGLVLPGRLDDFFLDLRADDFKTRFAVVHSRFSTNTLPSWERAHPYRRIAHNGEINTLRGNRNRMRAREALLASKVFGEHIEDFKPIIRPEGSDSASLDNVVDFLLASGRSLPHVMSMLVPEAFEGRADMSPELRDYYRYHAALVEPWDGPAGLVFTDGKVVGATIDRNGLRSLKYVATKHGFVALASELGVVDVDPADVIEKGALGPGTMLVADLERGRLVHDAEMKAELAAQKPYGTWLAAHSLAFDGLPAGPAPTGLDDDAREVLVRRMGWSREDVRVLVGPMANGGEEPIGSMGNDAALAVLSDRRPPLFRYFKQQFAQVTNPAIDPYFESLSMSLESRLGSEGNLLDETPEQARLLVLEGPVLEPAELLRLEHGVPPDLRVARLYAHFPADGDPAGALEGALDDLAHAAETAVRAGATILLVSDRATSDDVLPVPSLLAVAAVHQHLVEKGTRTRASIVVECGDAREVADVALLVGYGASAVCPYLGFEVAADLARKGELDKTKDPAEARAKYKKALHKGLRKVLSKMGIGTLAGYQGAQIFETLGLGDALVERFFTGTASRLGGIGLAELAEDVRARGVAARDTERELDVGGVYAWRATGERHLWTPRTVAALQKAVRLEDAKSYDDYARAINEQGDAPLTLRGLWDFRPNREPVPLDQVEPAEVLVRRFQTGAMSFGSISKEAHETLAVAMNRIGGKSNSGEGGEDEARFVPDARGDLRRSAIKQVASGRFGVTAHYLVNAEDIQIKVAQGAKPGEGGQLPGHKVDVQIARVRHSTPGVTLISPPPHHDIYSIEDLAQLIFDLRAVSPRARIGVKLVSESGIGTIAAGVAKAHADCILVAGHDGGTGASPLSSVQHAGTPWELGLAEVEQALVAEGLRGRVTVQVDGQLKTGRDVAFAALLGGEEFGFATAPLVATGCIMMRKCHLNTCPVGIATQDPVLRARFTGLPEHVVRYFFYVAEELRGIMARLGYRSLDEMVGQVEVVAAREGVGHPRAAKLDFTRVLASPPEGARARQPREPYPAGSDLDRRILDDARSALETGEPRLLRYAVQNSQRAVGAGLAGEVARRRGAAGLPDDTLRIELEGSGGQSFGAFATKGMTLDLVGDANDYVGKALSGGVLVVRPHADAAYAPASGIVVGSTVLYGATGGRAFFRGRAGERFAVRNSGAHAVVEGVGFHGCEYMTGGVVVVLGTTGENFAAGMSGGVAYVLDEDGRFAGRLNADLVRLETLDGDDARDVTRLLEEHVLRTKSDKAEAVLRGLAAGTAPLVKVMPVEYAKILLARKAGEAGGGQRGGGGSSGGAREVVAVASGLGGPAGRGEVLRG